jgi:hypothetical protein
LESVVREVAQFKKPVVLAEFGWYGGGQLTLDQGRHRPASEADQARWCRLAVETTRGLAVGWLNWGLYDHPQARDVSQLTGLLKTDGGIKAWGTEMRQLAQQFRRDPPRMRPNLELNRPSLDWDRLITSHQAVEQYRDRYLSDFKSATK